MTHRVARDLLAVCLVLVGSAGLAGATSESSGKRRPVADWIAGARQATSDDAAGPATSAETGAPPAVDAGVGWLESHQNADGSWGGDLEWIVTSTVVESLGTLDSCLDVLPGAAEWLTTQGAAPNHEFLARQVSALSRVTGHETMVSRLAASLLAERNPAEPNSALPNWPEGGWGLAEGYETDSLTTALALLALDRTGFNGGFAVANRVVAGGATNLHTWQIPSDAVRVRILITVAGAQIRLRMRQGSPPTDADPFFPLLGGPFLIVFPDSGLPFTPGTNHISIQNVNAPAATYTMTVSYETPTFDTRTLAEPLEYLRQAQNVDDGWGIQRGQPSELYTTLHVLAALLRYAQYEFAGVIGPGIAHVKSLQHGDGSFGYSGTPIAYVTALAALDLVRSEGGAFSQETEDAITALSAMQAGNGSWDQEPYDTVLAVLALWEHERPPAANAGADQVVTDVDENCTQSATLSGSGTAFGGSIVAYAWRVACVQIASGSSPTINLPVGRHRIELVVTDSSGQTGHDTVEIDVFGPDDTDGDAIPEACGDCDDANGQVWDGPGDVVMALSQSSATGQTTIDWGPAEPGGLLFPRYDLLRSPDRADFVTPGICLESDEYDTSALDDAGPAPGGVFHYLVRVENDCPGPGNMGTNSSGTPRIGVACP